MSATTAITPYKGVISPGAEGSYWKDWNTLKNVQCILSNLFLSKAVIEVQNLAIVNLPLRAWNTFHAYDNQEYWKIAFDVMALASLFFPYGRQAAIVIDCLSEAVNVYRKAYHPKPPVVNEELIPKILVLDCTVRKNALDFMGLTEEDLKNTDRLEKEYNTVKFSWNRLFNHLQPGNPLLPKVNDLIEKLEASYKTLKQPAPEEPGS